MPGRRSPDAHRSAGMRPRGLWAVWRDNKVTVVGRFEPDFTQARTAIVFPFEEGISSRTASSSHWGSRRAKSDS